MSVGIDWKDLPEGLAYGDRVYVDLFTVRTNLTIPVSRTINKKVGHTYIGMAKNNPDKWALSVDADERLTFTVEKAPHGAFALRESTTCHCLVRAGDWISFGVPEDGENESLGWESVDDYYRKSEVHWNTSSEPYLLYFWARGSMWPLRATPDDHYLTFKRSSGFNGTNYDERAVIVTKVPAGAGQSDIRSKL